jgi:hypothetical protein
MRCEGKQREHAHDRNLGCLVKLGAWLALLNEARLPSREQRLSERQTAGSQTGRMAGRSTSVAFDTRGR